MTETKAKQEGYIYIGSFPTRIRAEWRSLEYKELGFDTKIIDKIFEYRLYVKKEV